MYKLKSIFPGLSMVLIGFIAIAMTTNDIIPDQQANQDVTLEEITLQGTVVDSTSGEPISGVEVNIAELEEAVETNENGEFTVEGLVDGETYTLSIAHEGYEEYEQTIEAISMGSPTIEITVELTPSEAEDQ